MADWLNTDDWMIGDQNVNDALATLDQQITNSDVSLADLGTGLQSFVDDANLQNFLTTDWSAFDPGQLTLPEGGELFFNTDSGALEDANGTVVVDAAQLGEIDQAILGVQEITGDPNALEGGDTGTGGVDATGDATDNTGGSGSTLDESGTGEGTSGGDAQVPPGGIGNNPDATPGGEGEGSQPGESGPAGGPAGNAGGPTTGATSGGGSVASGTGSAAQPGGTGPAGQRTNSNTNPQDAFTRLNQALGPLNQFLGTSVGGTLGALGLGGLGLGLSKLLSGGSTKFELPAQIATPLTPGEQALKDAFARDPSLADSLTAGVKSTLGAQKTVADLLGQEAGIAKDAQTAAAPGQADVRAKALATLQNLADPTAIPTDPVTAGLRQSVLDVMSGKVTNPVLARDFAKEREQLTNRELATQGQNWADSSPGIELKTKLDESQSIRRYNDWLNTLQTIEPLYANRVNQGVNTNTGLSFLGVSPSQSIASTLQSIVPTSRLTGMGTNTAGEDARTLNSLQNQLALSSFAAQNARDAGTAQSIASLFGTAAGGLLGGGTRRSGNNNSSSP